jgi:hypothetical protein
MKTIKIFGRYWTVKDVKNHPDYLFIFGDNDIKRGRGGQAIIRDEPNAIGIPTKKYPTRKLNAYYTDKEYEENKKKINLSIQIILKEFMKDTYTTLIIPKDGFGTGLAKLHEKAPKTFKYLEKKVKALTRLFI